MKNFYIKVALLFIKKGLQIFLFYLIFIPCLEASNSNPKEFKENNPKDSSTKVTSIKVNNLKNLLLERNKSIKSLRSKIKQSESNYKSKIGLLYPRLYLNSNDLPRYINGNDYSNSGNDTSTNKLSLGFNANLDWGIIKPSRKLEIKIAEEELTNAKYLLNSKINDIYLESIKLFYKIQATYQEISLAKKSIEISELALLESQEKYKAGIGNKIEVLEANTQLDRDQIKKVKKIGELNKTKNSLYLLLDSEKDFIVEEDKNFLINFIWDINLEKSLLEAYKNRNDLKIKKKDISISNKKSRSIRSEKQPEFTLYNQYSLSKSWGENDVRRDPSFDTQNKKNSNSIGVKFTWNLFDGGIIKQRYISQFNRTNELKNEYELSKNQIKNKLIDSFLDLEISKKNIIYSYNQLNSAKETLTISLKRLNAGLTTQREIVNIQADLSEAESNYINSILNYNLTLAELERLTLVEKKDICDLKYKKEENINNSFYKFIIKNNLNIPCESIS